MSGSAGWKLDRPRSRTGRLRRSPRYGPDVHSRWAPEVPADDTFRAPPGRSIAEASAEQDEAAGGRERRLVRLPDGTRSLASIELKRVSGRRRIYGYLRYTHEGRTVARYVGQAPGDTRTERLRAAWSAARSRGLVG